VFVSENHTDGDGPLGSGPHQEAVLYAYSSFILVKIYTLRNTPGVGFSSVSVEAKLSFVEPGRRWAHSPSPSKAPGISYQGTMKTSVRMLKTSGGL